MPNQTDSKSGWQQIRGLVLAAGALAGAILAVIGLWNLFFSPDEGEQASVDLTMVQPVNLHDFDFDQATDGLPTAPEGMADVHMTIDLVAAPSPRSDELVDDSTTELTETPSETSEPSTPSTTTPTPTPTPGPETETGSPGPAGGFGDAVPDIATLEALAASPDLEKYDTTPDQVKALYAIRPENVDLADAAGDALSPDDAAAQLAAALDEAEASEENGTLNPQGYNVAVNFQLDWLRGERLVMTWSVQGGDPDSGWALDRMAVRFSQTTEQYGGTAYIWLPDLESPGDHTV